jgi:hypothetical protein
LDCPDFARLTETLHKGHSFVEVGQVYHGVVEKGKKIEGDS